jgi:hypothetical protein
MSDTTQGARVTYLVQGEMGGPIKIGRSNTKSLGSRIAALQTGYPYQLKIVRLIEGDLEAELHSRFAHLRMNGEWFAPGDELLAFAGSEATKGGHQDFRDGFAAGFASATTEFEVRTRSVLRHMDEPLTLSIAMEEAMEEAVRNIAQNS